MRKNFFFLLAGILLTVAVATTTVHYELRKNTAETNQVQGVYIFTDSKPATAYEVLGDVKFSGTGGYAEVRDILVKRAKKKYPDAEGIIISNSDQADIIKFK